jgi:16S rRNA (guanine527-N7)-methyltransferase
MTLVRSRPSAVPAGWDQQDAALLDRGLDELSLEPTATQRQQLHTYAQLLLKWNRTYNLLGATTAAALVQDHLLDSLAVLQAIRRWLPLEAHLFDIGSGAGLPGIVLAIMLAPLDVALVEPSGKKAAFLRQAVPVCHLENVQVIESRIEAIGATVGSEASAGGRLGTPHFICRAFTSLSRFAALTRPHLHDGSLIFAMKAARVGDELVALEDWVEVLAVESLRPATKAVQRNLVVMRAKRHPPAGHNPLGPLAGPA